MKSSFSATFITLIALSLSTPLFAKTLSGSILLNGKIYAVSSTDKEITVGKRKFQISDNVAEMIMADMEPVTGEDIQLLLVWGSKLKSRKANLKQYLKDAMFANPKEVDCAKGNALLEIIDNTKNAATWGNCLTITGI